MSKFLFVSSYDLRRNTSGNIRTVALMNALHDNGHIVHCIFIPSSHNSDKNIYDNLVNIDKCISFPKNEPITFINNPIIKKEQKNLLSSLRSLLIKLYSALTVYDVFEIALSKLADADLAEIDDSYDYIVSSSEPRSSHKFAEKIIKLKKLKTKWVLYWGDPMSNDVASTKLFSYLESQEEKRLIDKSDFSIYTNPCAVSFMKKKYPSLSKKIDWIPTSDFKTQHRSDEKGNVLKIGYFGDYMKKYRNISPFYNACLNNRFNTVIIGGGDIKLKSNGTVAVYGRMPRENITQFENECGILIVLENISKTKECIQVPGKLYHYGLTYKHIIVITESENISREYEAYKRFTFVKNDEISITKAIRNIQNNLNDDILNEPVKEFQYDNISKLFMDKIKQI